MYCTNFFQATNKAFSASSDMQYEQIGGANHYLNGNPHILEKQYEGMG